MISDRRRVLDLFDGQSDFVSEKTRDGIERYRKGDAHISLKSESGEAVQGARIRLVQKNHEFRFGANLFMLDEMETTEKNEAYKRYFAELFNMATLPFYWNTLEPERGKPRYSADSPKIYRRPAIDLCIDFCEKHGIEPREHALAYDNFFPDWLVGADTSEVKREYERRCAEIAERYADKIRTIEVTNEMEWREGRTKFYDERDFIEWCFKTAEKYFPDNQLCINEHTGLCWGDCCRATDKYYSYIEANMLRGARIDAIGMQFHLFNKRENEYDATRRTLDPKSIYAHLDLYAGLGKPLQITEVTVPAYSWESEDEEIQADIIENLYSIWFSHPFVEQIIYWNLADGYAHVWNPDPVKIKESMGNMSLGENYYHGGLFRFDMTPKPAYLRLKDLIEKVWHTEGEIVTNESGKASFRGFFGDYTLEIIKDGKREMRDISLSRSSDNKYDIIF